MRSKHLAAAAVLSLAVTSVCGAATKTWLGTDPTGTYFDVAGNWTPSGAPGSSDTALFNLNSAFSVLFDGITGSPTNNFLDVEAGNVTWAHLSAANPTTYTAPTLTIDNGSTLQLEDLMKFVNTNSFINRGSSLIVKDKATFTSTGTLHFGGGGTAAENKFIIHAGGTATTAGTNLGEGTGLSARATLDGASAVWNLTGDLNFGLFGNGFGNITNGGKISGVNSWLGSQNGSTGTVTVANANSRFLMSQNLMVGSSSTGKGSFTTTDNAGVGVGDVGVGQAFDSGFSIASSDTSGNNGNVRVINGSTLTHNAGGAIQIAGGTNSYGLLQVSGTGSSATTNNALQVGFAGQGFLDLSGGGTATAQEITAGQFTGGVGTITIGSGSVLQSNHNVLFGPNGGIGTETISAGGRMNVGNNSSGGSNLGLFLADTNLGGGGGGNLTINAGSTLTHSSGMTARIGSTNSYGNLTVTGANAKFITNNGSGIALAVDTNAKGFLNVMAGGYAEAPGITAGGFGSTGTVLVDGANSTLKITGNFDLSSTAGAGTGIVTTSNGGTLLVGDVAALSTSWDLLVSDADPIGTNGGVLTVRDGSQLTTHLNSAIGVFPGQTGRVVVTGTGSKWKSSQQVGVAYQGTGELLVSSGGLVDAPFVTVGQFSSANGTINVTAGGRVQSSSVVYLGDGVGTTATATVSGASSSMAASTLLVVGSSGTGTLNISTGGKVTANDAIVGAAANGVGSIVMTDGLPLLDIDHDMTVGNAAGGVDSINHTAGLIRVGDAAGSVPAYGFDVSDSNLDGSNGGNVRFDNGATYTGNQIITLGEAGNTRGSLTVAGGANVSPGGGVVVGDFGTGVLKIQTGGNLIAGTNGVIFGLDGGSGTATVDGTGSSLQALSNLSLHHGSTLTDTSGGGFVVGSNAAGFPANVATIGHPDNGAGKLTIDGGSSITHNGDAVITPFSNTFGTVLVSGTNSLFKVNGTLYSYAGTSDVQVTAGGTIEATNAVIQNQNTGQLTATVTGANSILNILGGMTFGQSGQATLNIFSGGTVKTVNDLAVGQNSGASATINLSGTGSLLDVGGNLNIAPSGTGSVHLSGGTLKAATITRGTSSTFDFSGGTLVNHTFTGQLVQNGGTLSPGNVGTTDTMFISNGYAMNSGTFAFDLVGSAIDVLAVTGTASLNGSLAINAVSPTTSLGASGVIVSGTSVTGHFATVTGYALSPTRYLAVTYTPGSARVTIALPGDATLSNGVGFPDLVALAQNYNGTGKVWAQGDFNGDGTVGFADLVLLAQNYNHSSIETPGALSASFASDWALAQSVAPEPTSLLAVSSLATMTLRRRRSR